MPYNFEPVVTDDDDDDDESSSSDSSHDEDERTSNTTWYSKSTSFINTIFILIKVLLWTLCHNANYKRMHLLQRSPKGPRQDM